MPTSIMKIKARKLAMFRNRQRLFIVGVSSLLVMDAVLHVGLILIHGHQSIQPFVALPPPPPPLQPLKPEPVFESDTQPNDEISEYDEPVAWPPGFLQDKYQWNLEDWLKLYTLNTDLVKKDGYSYFESSWDRDYLFLDNSRLPCIDGGKNLPLLVIVNSNPDNMDARAAIRDTWGGELISLGVKLLFLVGKSLDLYTEETIVQEKATYVDIIQADFMESDYNWTLKAAMTLNWSATYCPKVRYVLKVEDDVFVNVTGLRQVLKRPDPHRNTVLGYLHRFGVEAARLNTSKWFVPYKLYPWNDYPAHIARAAYLLSSQVVSRLTSSFPLLPFFFLEDVSLLGMLANVSGVLLDHTEAMAPGSQPADRCGIVSSPGHSPQLMRRKWTIIKSRFFRCGSVLLDNGEIDYLIET